MARSRKKKNWLTLLGTVWALLPGLYLVLYYITGPAEGHMTSDCTDSLRWAQATFESGRLVAQDFSYSAILPFGGNLVFLPFIALFGFSMKAQIGGLVFFALLFAAALWYLARGLDLSLPASGGLVSVVMLALCASGKLREIVWEHVFYYNLGILFFCFGFGLLLRLLKDADKPRGEKKKALFIIRLILFFVCSVMIATDGLQAMICYTLPLAAAILADRLTDAETPLFAKKNSFPWILLLTLVLSFALGSILRGKISGDQISGYADGYSVFSGMGEWSDNLLKLFNNWLSLTGVSVTPKQSFMEVNSIIQAIRIFASLIIFLVPLILVFRLPKIKDRGLRLIAAGHGAVSAFILFAVIFGVLGNANWRLTPMYGTALITGYLAAAAWLKEKKGLATRGGGILLAVMILAASLPGAEIVSMKADDGRDNAWHTAAAMLEARGLQHGYASFWWAELISMISDGKVEAVNIEVGENGLGKRYYQQPRNSYSDKDADRYFLLLTEQESTTLGGWLQQKRQEGMIREETVIPVKRFAAGNDVGDLLFLYVLSENPF